MVNLRSLPIIVFLLSAVMQNVPSCAKNLKWFPWGKPAHTEQFYICNQSKYLCNVMYMYAMGTPNMSHQESLLKARNYQHIWIMNSSLWCTKAGFIWSTLRLMVLKLFSKLWIQALLTSVCVCCVCVQTPTVMTYVPVRRGGELWGRGDWPTYPYLELAGRLNWPFSDCKEGGGRPVIHLSLRSPDYSFIRLV